VDPRTRAITLAACGAVGLLTVVLALVLGGAAPPSTPLNTIGADAADASTPVPEPSSTSFGVVATQGSGEAVTIAFGGDIHFEGRVGQVLARDPAGVLAGVRPLLAGADLAMANLETAVTERGTPVEGKEYTFRAPARAFAALGAGGLDVVSMANNHGLDYGSTGLADSLAAARGAGFPVVGIGQSATEAYAPWTTTVKGQRIAIIGATAVLDDNLRSAWTAGENRAGLASAYETERLMSAVRAARLLADTLVVYLHWGTEGQTCPNDTQPTLARSLVDAGADIVVGGHSHRVEGAGRMGGAYVAYGLGNFAFYKDSGPGTESGVLVVTATGRRIDRADWHPVRLVGQLPRTLRGAEATEASKSWDALRACTGLG